MRKKRLLKAIKVLKNVKNKDFSMDNWQMCAIGHICKKAYFTKRGLSLVGGGGNPTPMFEGTHGVVYEYDAIAEFFDISFMQAMLVFVDSYYDDRENVTKKDVIKKIKMLVNDNL